MKKNKVISQNSLFSSHHTGKYISIYNNRLAILIIFPIFCFYHFYNFYKSFVICESIATECNFIYVAEHIMWKKEEAVPFSYDMTIHHNTTTVIKEENKNSKYILNTGKLGAAVYCPRDSHYITNTTYAVVPNVYVGLYSGFGNETNYIDVNDPPGVITFRVASFEGNVRKVCDNLIAVGHRWCRVFGHFVMDILVTMLFLPTDVFHNSKLLLSANITRYKELYTAIGFRNDQFIFMEKNEFIFANKLHTIINHQPIHGNIVLGMRELGDKIKKYYHHENIEAKYIGLQNRVINRSRHIANFNDVVKECQNKYGDEIVVIQDVHATLSDAIKIFASMRVLFGPSGSNFANMIYMKEGCAIVMACANWMNGSFTALSIGLNIWCVCMNIKHMSHWHYTPNCNIEVDKVLLAIDAADYASKNQKWGVKYLPLLP